MSNWFANPAALWLGLLIGPLLALYILRHRPVKKRVPSILLWAGTAQMQVATSPFQRLRRSVSLILMLAALLFLVLALGGLRIPEGERRGLPLTLIVDVTAGMSADAPGGTRLDLAVERARRVIDAAGNSDVAVMAFDGGLRPLTTGSVAPGEAIDSLNGLRVAHRGADDSALIHAVEHAAEEGHRIVVVTDHHPGDFERDVHVEVVGAAALNAGIVSASLSEGPLAQVDLFFGVEVAGTDNAVTIPFRLERISRGGTATLADARDVTVIPGQRAAVTFRDVAPGLYAGSLRIDDAFALDDRAWLRYSELPTVPVVPTDGTPDPVLRAAEAIGEATGIIRVVHPGDENRDRSSYLFADAEASGASPRLPSVYFAPHATPPGASYGDASGVAEGATRPTSSFLWRGAGAPDIRLMEVHSIEASARLSPVLHAGEHTAIALASRRNGLQDLLIAAPLEDAAGFTGKSAFVIFWTNWFEYVRRSAEPLPRGAVSTRDTVRVPALTGRGEFGYGLVDDNDMTVTAPGVPLRLDRVGTYQFEGLDDTDLPRLGVSLLDPVETAHAAGAPDDREAGDLVAWLDAFEGRGESRDLALGPWLALIAAALLMTDWFLFRRRFPTRTADGKTPPAALRRHTP